MKDIAMYKVQNSEEVGEVDAAIAAWQKTALIDTPWSTMQLGVDSLTNALHTHSPPLLDSQTYGVGFHQTFSLQEDPNNNGAMTYLPISGSIETTSQGQPACNVYKLTENCSSLKYDCINYSELPWSEAGHGVNVGGMDNNNQTRRFHAAADLRPMLEVLHQNSTNSNYTTSGMDEPTLAQTLNTRPWGCPHLPMCDTCCQPGNALSCCRRGHCCPRADVCPN